MVINTNIALRVLDEIPRPMVVLGAMDIETSFVEAALVGARVQEFGGFRFMEGALKGSAATEPDGQTIVVGTTGMGSTNAAAACMLAIREYNPRYIISQGTAGAHDPTLHTGDIVLGARIVPINYVRTPPTDTGAGIHPTEWEYIGPSSVFAESDAASQDNHLLTSDTQLLEAAQAPPYDGGRLVTGTLGSGDVWNRELDRIAFFHERFGTLCEDMESYAVAQVCAGLGVPHLALRVISNSEYHEEETFDPSTAEKAQRFTLEFIRNLEQKS